MQHRWSRSLPVFLTLLAVMTVSPVLAQQATDREGVFTDSIDVELANIEVFVSDRRGYAIDGLERQDFTLLVDGEPVEIVNFSAVHGGQVELQGQGSGERQEAGEATVSPPSPGMPMARPLNLVVYVDVVFMRNDSLRLVLPEVRRFLEKRVPAGSRVMLVVYNGRVNTMVPFTTDIETVVKAVEELRRVSGHGDLLDVAGEAALSFLGQVMATGEDGGGGTSATFALYK